MVSHKSTREFDDLLDQFVEAELDSTGLEKLNQLLSQQVELQLRFLDYLGLHSALEWDLAATPGIEMPAELAMPVDPATQIMSAENLVPVPVLRKPSILGRIRPVVYAELAVGVLFAAYFIVISWNMLGKYSASWRNAPQESIVASETTVATIRDVANVDWARSSMPKLADDTVAFDETMKIEAGRVELELKQGATLVVEGPAEWSVGGANLATLRRGRLIAKVPQQAHGFTLKTPAASIVDLGTEFGVEVAENGDAEVHVLQGEVDLQRIGGDRKQSTGQRLEAGKSARVTSAGAVISHNEEIERKFQQLADTSASRKSSGPNHAQKYAECVKSLMPVIFLPVDRNEGMALADRGEGNYVGRFTRTEGPGEAWDRGPFGDALSFRGPKFQDRVTLEPSEQNVERREIDFSRGKEPGLPFTIALWARCQFNQRTGLLVGKGHGFASQFLLDVLDNRYRFVIHNSAKQISGLITSQAAVDGTWQHVAAVFAPDRKSISLYVNGHLSAETTIEDLSLSPVAEAVMIGNRDFPNDPNKLTFTGALDEISIFDRALTAEEIDGLYHLRPAK